MISIEGDIFEVTRKWSKVNVLWRCQISLASAWWMRMIFMGFWKNIMCLRWCLYWWQVYSFALHFEYGCIISQLKYFTLDHLGSSTWKWSSIYLTKCFWCLVPVERLYVVCITLHIITRIQVRYRDMQPLS